MRFATTPRFLSVVAAAATAVGCAGGPAAEIAPPSPRGSLERVSTVEPRGSAVEIAPVGSLIGGVTVLGDSARAADLGPVVVLLEPPRRDGSKPPSGRSEPTVWVESRSPAFDPPFTAVRTGQRVRFVNRGPVKHRLFSAQLGAERTIELAPRARSQAVRLPPGPHRFFCSLHPSEGFVVFSSPTPYFAVASRGGAYRLADVPAGRYTLSIWSELVGGPVREVTVPEAGVRRERIWIDPALIPR